ncbi:MAG: hypothetical protein EAZ43_16120 [Betaproteobacteria bacterium]|nr:MAG: hypothetical protein EAZ43_16120 [Betaproteobacteria bacterium]
MSDPSKQSSDSTAVFTDELQHIERDLLQAVKVAPLDPMAERFMKSRLMSRVSTAERSLETQTIGPADGQWQRFSPRIKIKVLNAEPNGESMSYLLRFEPGAFLVPHRHAIDEECVVLEGEITIGELCVGPGTYHLAPKGRVHEPIRSERGATLFVRGKPPHWTDTAVKETLRALLR